MRATALETSLCLHFEQIVEGEAKCVYCENEAKVTMCTGADPELEPVCLSCAREFFACMDRALAMVWAA